MRKVELRMKEHLKYELIKKLVETNGNKKRVALKLGCSIRTINRLIHTYKNEGKQGFIHGNRNRKPPTSISDETKKYVIELYATKYVNANIRHFSELLWKHEDIKVNETTLLRWLKESDILSPKARRKTKKQQKQKLLQQKNTSTTNKEIVDIENKLDLLERSEAHPHRPRCAYFGELIQMDASPHIWFNNMITHLHLAIDDTTGKIVGAFFDTQETLHAYYQITHQILSAYGIPAKILTDRRTVFEYKRKNAPSDEEDTFTQYSYACKQLGIELECSSVPQAKGRVERLNQTLQSRLVVELGLADIQTIEDANLFLNHYIKEFNQQFALPINDTKSVFEAQVSKETIHQTLAILSSRKIDGGHCIRYKKKYYCVLTSNSGEVFLKKGTTALVIESFDKKLYVNILDQLYALKEVPQRLENSENFDEVSIPKIHKIYIPPMSHPWKHASFQAYLAKQKHRSEYGANV